VVAARVVVGGVILQHGKAATTTTIGEQEY
jgi:hypothetical protein